MEYLQRLNLKSMKLGTETINKLFVALNIDFIVKLNIFHIVGTNGKGSVANKLSKSLTTFNKAKKVGVFTSPHITTVRERISINENLVSSSELNLLGNILEQKSLEIEVQPTFFEALTLISLLHFGRSGCDTIILEAGMGGKNDSTNIVFKIPKVVVLTSLGYDHMEHLGHTLEEILENKIGCIRAGDTLVVSESLEEKYINICSETCRTIGANLVIAPLVSSQKNCLFGSNDSLSLSAINEIFPISQQEKSGMLTFIQQQKLPCRQELYSLSSEGLVKELTETDVIKTLSTRKILMLDVAHNPQGLTAVRSYLDNLFMGRNVSVTVVLGLSNNKHPEECFKALFQDTSSLTFKKVIFVEGDVPERSTDASFLLETFKANFKISAETANLEESLKTLYNFESDVVLFCGSFFIMKALKTQIGSFPNNQVDEVNLNEKFI